MTVESNERVPVVLDTDIGTDVDDAFALALALASPDIDLIAVTVTNGDVDLRARIASRLLGLAGRSDVPVYIGEHERVSPTALPTGLGHEGRGVLDVPHTGAEARIEESPASAWLVEVSRRRPVHLVCIGPLTNVARAVESDPGFAGRLASLTIMGGMVHPATVPGRWAAEVASGTDPASFDYNTQCDPYAALLVARSGARTTWIPIEVTLATPLWRQQLETVAGVHHPFLDALVRMTEVWVETFMSNLHDPWETGLEAVAVLHDPLTLSALTAAPWLDLAGAELAYAVTGDQFRTVPRPGGSPATVAVSVDGAVFARHMVERLVTHFSARSPTARVSE